MRNLKRLLKNWNLQSVILTVRLCSPSLSVAEGGEAKNLHINQRDSSVAEFIRMDSPRMTGWGFSTRLKGCGYLFFYDFVFLVDEDHFGLVFFCLFKFQITVGDDD